jgi:hypothetical protein
LCVTVCEDLFPSGFPDPLPLVGPVRASTLPIG